jgi:cell division protein FtsL
MPKKYRRNFSRGKRPVLKPGIIITLIFALGLLLIWKSYKVKDYYAKTKDMEKLKSELTSEIDELKANLMDLKSISRVGEEVKRYGLTQNVSGRLNIEIPMVKDSARNRKAFVDMDQVADWLEEAVFKSGQINAKEKEE